MVEFLGEGLYLGVCAGLLVHELVRGEGKDLETLVPIALVQGHQLRIGLVCEPSLAGHVDHHYTLLPFRQRAPQSGQLLAVDVHSWHVVESLLGGCRRLSDLVLASLEDHARDYRLSHGDRLILF